MTTTYRKERKNPTLNFSSSRHRIRLRRHLRPPLSAFKSPSESIFSRSSSTTMTGAAAVFLA
ncbi:hypothetical protein E2C01_059494 [Portunus trituberculatus]|uniref:Uncharacterized protein n=1 Tax=Portunus trituberculatus TaxID=210409 RepID=A0A5B7GZB3_PORTR|nr:hypothetical protein [Portunus trituberculatus]